MKFLTVCLLIALVAVVSVEAISMRHMARGQADAVTEFPAIPAASSSESSAAQSMPSISDQLTMKEPAAASAPVSAESASEPAPAALLAVGCTSGAPGCDANGPLGRLATVMPSSGKQDKLEVALHAIKQDILVRNRQINDEKAWVAQVRKVIDQYQKKVKRVLDDIEKTKMQVKVLFKKKKQIENLKIQRQLEQKLKDATADLATLKSALKHVKTKATEFSKTKNEIKKTIISIHTQLAKLKGVKDPKKLKAIQKRLSKE